MTGRDMNQERALKGSGETRWSSHFNTLENLIYLFSSVIDVLDVIAENGTLSIHKAQATDLPVASATVKRAFSAMKFIKNSLRNRMGDELMNDCLLIVSSKKIEKVQTFFFDCKESYNGSLI